MYFVGSGCLHLLVHTYLEIRSSASHYYSEIKAAREISTNSYLKVFIATTLLQPSGIKGFALIVKPQVKQKDLALSPNQVGAVHSTVSLAENKKPPLRQAGFSSRTMPSIAREILSTHKSMLTLLTSVMPESLKAVKINTSTYPRPVHLCRADTMSHSEVHLPHLPSHPCQQLLSFPACIYNYDKCQLAKLQSLHCYRQQADEVAHVQQVLCQSYKDQQMNTLDAKFPKITNTDKATEVFFVFLSLNSMPSMNTCEAVALKRGQKAQN